MPHPDLRDWQTAVDRLRSDADAPEGAPGAEAWKCEEFKLKVIQARVKLKLMRDRTEALRDALERFRSKRESLRA